MRKLGLAVVLVGVVGAPAAVSAQEPARIGITMGYPASLGIVWRVTDRVALRPEFAFAHASLSGIGPVSTGDSSTNVGVGASALFYFRSTDDALRPYVTPRWSYGHTSAGNGITSDGTHSVAGSFGAEYMLGKRFSVFGETGLEYSHSSAKFGVATATQGANRIATRTGAGVVFYF